MTKRPDMLAFQSLKDARMRKIVLIAWLVCLASASALAQAPGDAVKALVGDWEISTADREKSCNLSFKSDAVKGGYRIEFDKACASVFPATREVEVWALVKDDLKLLDAKGRTVFDFTEVETGMYEAERGNEGLYFLQSLASAATPAARTAEDMFGDWVLARAGKSVCTLALTRNGAGGEMGYALRVQPGCDAAVTRLNPVTWRMDRGELVLSSANGQSLRFEEYEPNKWQRVPESAEGLTMARK
jgi:hypothetical protein